mmetsp:Transcript_6162/g.10207  ORF Transcript_6162/g.10207 Transcript_6162/m.10207 type:complete len:269 (-) Transcript_6162:607-1413(-)
MDAGVGTNHDESRQEEQEDTGAKHAGDHWEGLGEGAPPPTGRRRRWRREIHVGEVREILGPAQRVSLARLARRHALDGLPEGLAGGGRARSIVVDLFLTFGGASSRGEPHARVDHHGAGLDSCPDIRTLDSEHLRVRLPPRVNAKTFQVFVDERREREKVPHGRSRRRRRRRQWWWRRRARGRRSRGRHDVGGRRQRRRRGRRRMGRRRRDSVWWRRRRVLCTGFPICASSPLGLPKILAVAPRRPGIVLLALLRLYDIAKCGTLTLE